MTAYLISSYRQPEQVARLVRLLARDGSAIVLIHHDLAAPAETFDVLKREVGRIDNVVLLPQRVCRYATFDHVRVTLAGMRWLLDRGIDFHHLVLLTGQCYPIRPIAEIESFLGDRIGRSLLDTHVLPREGWPDGGFNRVSAWSLPVRIDRVPDALMRVLPKRQGYLSVPKPALVRYRVTGKLDIRLPRGIDRLYGGIGYWAMAQHHVEYVVGDSGRLDRFFRFGYIPDELYFQTALMNSPLAAEVINSPVHLVDYGRHGGLSPYTYRAEDFDAIARASTAGGTLFARKFDIDVDATVLDRIDTELLDREASVG